MSDAVKYVGMVLMTIAIGLIGVFVLLFYFVKQAFCFGDDEDEEDLDEWDDDERNDV